MTAPAQHRAFPPTQPIRILVYENFEPIDVFGFAEAFTIAGFVGTDHGSPPPYPFADTLNGRRREAVRRINGPAVLPDCSTGSGRWTGG